MGENVQKGTIDEINQIFRDKTGLDVDFFETDMSSIADSYAYSMAKAKGRESYFRRLMDFGDDTVQVIGTKLSPNNKLIGELTDAHKKLIQARNALTTKVSAGRKGVTSKAQGVLKQAQDILDGKARKGADVDKKIAGVKATLEGIENQLSGALLSAQGKQANEVAGFLEMWGPLLDEVRIMRTALENGQAEEYAVVKQLKEIYAALYPTVRCVSSCLTRSVCWLSILVAYRLWAGLEQQRIMPQTGCFMAKWMTSLSVRLTRTK